MIKPSMSFANMLGLALFRQMRILSGKQIISTVQYHMFSGMEHIVIM